MLGSLSRFQTTLSIDRTLAEIEQREGRPIAEVIDQQLSESRQVIQAIEARKMRHYIEYAEGKRLEKIPISRLKAYLAGYY